MGPRLSPSVPGQHPDHGPFADLNYPMHLPVHKDMRKVRRVSAFFDYYMGNPKPVLVTAI